MTAHRTQATGEDPGGAEGAPAAGGTRVQTWLWERLLPPRHVPASMEGLTVGRPFRGHLGGILTVDPALLLPSIHPRETGTGAHTDTCPGRVSQPDP